MGFPGDLQDECWANAAYAGHVDLMQHLKGSARTTPNELPAVAFGCPLAVLQRMLWECMRRWAPLTDSQLAEIMAGAVSSPTPDWQVKVTWLLRDQGHSPIHALGPCAARDLAMLPDAEQRLVWLAGQEFGLVGCQELLKAAVGAGNAELVSMMRPELGGPAVRGPEREAYAKALVTLAVEKGHLGVARELHDRELPVALGEICKAAGATGRVDVAQWVLRVPKEQQQQQQPTNQRQEQHEEAPGDGAAKAWGAGAGAGTGESLGHEQGQEQELIVAR